MFLLVINGLDHPRGSLSSNCLLTLRVTLLEKKPDQTNPKPPNNLEAFKGCKWISIHFPVYKNWVVLNNLLNCRTISSNALDFSVPFQRGSLCWEGGLQCRFVSTGCAGDPAATFLSSVWCSRLLGAAWGSSQSSAGRRPSRHGAGCLFSKPLYLRLLVRLMLG